MSWIEYTSKKYYPSANIHEKHKVVGNERISNRAYRKYMQTNSTDIMQTNSLRAFRDVGYGSGNPINLQNNPFSTYTIITSDLKNMFLKQSRNIVIIPHIALPNISSHLDKFIN